MKTDDTLFRRLRTLGHLALHALDAYFRVEVEGIENIPKDGAAVIAPNHSGFAGADALVLAHVIRRATRRRPRILAHRAFFDLSKRLKIAAFALGLRRAGIEQGVRILQRGKLLILFPEGEKGNFKPSSQRYQLQRFRTGFLRITAETRAPIVPCVILGAEESHLNLGTFRVPGKWATRFPNLQLPLPLNLIPLPAKWKIVFLPPIQAPVEELTADTHRLRLEARRFQENLQTELRKLVKRRRYVFFESTRNLERAARRRLARLRKPPKEAPLSEKIC